jgi:acetyltransferase-like isoleucine patch superfamily enzyme
MIESIVRKLLNKPEFSISKDVPLSYIIRLAIDTVEMISRGYVKRIGFKKVGKRLMVGRKTKLLVKNRMYFGNNIRLGNNVKIDALSEKGVILHDNVKIGDDSIVMVTGTLSNLGRGIEIGSNSSFSDSTFFGAAGGITIGSDVISGQSVRFHAENHNYSDPNRLIRLQGVNRKGIEVGDDVWIGAGSVFLDGSKVGSGSIVAANTVVTKEFPKDSIIGGIPARVIGLRNCHPINYHN